MATIGDDSNVAKGNTQPPAASSRPLPSRSRPIYDAQGSSLAAPPRKLWSTNQKSRVHQPPQQGLPGASRLVPEKTLCIRDEQEFGQVQPGAVHMMGTNHPPASRSMDTHEDLLSPRIQHEMVPPEYAHVESGMLSAIAVEDSSVVHEATIINTKRQRILRILFVAAILIVVIGVVVPVVLTISKDSSIPHEIRFEVMIENLCSPRHLTVHNGKLYVPEAGVGPMIISGDRETPPAFCLPSSLRAISGDICCGNTGQVNVFNLDGSADDPQLAGLFSARPTEGGFTNQVYGASGVDFDDDGNMFTILGLGYVNATDLAVQGPELVFGSVLRGDEAVASPWVNVFEENYAGAPVPESNPFGIFIHDGTTYVVDAGADLLFTYLNVETAGTGEPDSVVVLPKIRNIPAVKPNPRGGPCNDVDPPKGPSFCGQYQDDQGNWLYTGNAVPTAVRINPKEPRQLFVAYLGGAIWNEPVSGIFVMDLVNGIPQNKTITSIQGDFWGVIDFDFYENDLIVLETNPGGFVPFDGRLSRVRVDTDGSIIDSQVITEDLYQPVGMTIHKDTIYLSNNTFNMGTDGCNGQILRAQLR